MASSLTIVNDSTKLFSRSTFGGQLDYAKMPRVLALIEQRLHGSKNGVITGDVTTMMNYVYDQMKDLNISSPPGVLSDALNWIESAWREYFHLIQPYAKLDRRFLNVMSANGVPELIVNGNATVEEILEAATISGDPGKVALAGQIEKILDTLQDTQPGLSAPNSYSLTKQRWIDNADTAIAFDDAASELNPDGVVVSTNDVLCIGAHFLFQVDAAFDGVIGNNVKNWNAGNDVGAPIVNKAATTESRDCDIYGSQPAVGGAQSTLVFASLPTTSYVVDLWIEVLQYDSALAPQDSVITVRDSGADPNTRSLTPIGGYIQSTFSWNMRANLEFHGTQNDRGFSVKMVIKTVRPSPGVSTLLLRSSTGALAANPLISSIIGDVASQTAIGSPAVRNLLKNITQRLRSSNTLNAVRDLFRNFVTHIDGTANQNAVVPSGEALFTINYWFSSLSPITALSTENMQLLYKVWYKFLPFYLVTSLFL